MTEFEIIETYFAPLTMGQAGSAGLKDDAAVIEIPDGYELVVTSDTLNEGVHFLEGCAPADMARKVLRVNLSDLAAMGAKPLCYQMNIAFPEKPSEDWLSAFCGALMGDNRAYGIYCSGGDTTSIKGACLSISITAMGIVPKGKAVRRGGAQDGDIIVLTGAIGDAALGLKVLREGRGDDYPYAVSRYRVPEPRVGGYEAVQAYAHAAADVSDGFLADAMHIARASGLGAEIDLTNFTFSEDVSRALAEKKVDLADILSGGDDYELILAVSEANLGKLLSELKKNMLNPMVAGAFTSKVSGVEVYNSQRNRIDLKALGWSHF